MPSSRLPTIRFLDVEAAATRAVLRDELGELLAFYGYTEQERRPILRHDEALSRVASLYGLTVF